MLSSRYSRNVRAARSSLLASEMLQTAQQMSVLTGVGWDCVALSPQMYLPLDSLAFSKLS